MGMGTTWPGVCAMNKFPAGQKFSILPALSLDGILTLEIFEGYVNQEHFLIFLQNYLVCAMP